MLISDVASSSDRGRRKSRYCSARFLSPLGVAEAQGGFSGGAEAAFARAQESGQQYLIFSKIPVANEGDAGIRVSYEFDLFGKLRRGVEAANADSEATRAAGDLARITVVANVVRAYIENCSAAEELADRAAVAGAAEATRGRFAAPARCRPRQSAGCDERTDSGRVAGGRYSALHGAPQDRPVSARDAARACAIRSAACRARVQQGAADQAGAAGRRRRRFAQAPPRCARSRAPTCGFDGAYRRSHRRAVSHREFRSRDWDGRPCRRSRHVANQLLEVRTADQLDLPDQRRTRPRARSRRMRAPRRSRTSTAWCSTRCAKPKRVSRPMWPTTLVPMLCVRR